MTCKLRFFKVLQTVNNNSNNIDVQNIIQSHIINSQSKTENLNITIYMLTIKDINMSFFGIKLFFILKIFWLRKRVSQRFINELHLKTPTATFTVRINCISKILLFFIDRKQKITHP